MCCSIFANENKIGTNTHVFVFSKMLKRRVHQKLTGFAPTLEKGIRGTRPRKEHWPYKVPHLPSLATFSPWPLKAASAVVSRKAHVVEAHPESPTTSIHTMKQLTMKIDIWQRNIVSRAKGPVMLHSMECPQGGTTSFATERHPVILKTNWLPLQFPLFCRVPSKTCKQKMSLGVSSCWAPTGLHLEQHATVRLHDSTKEKFKAELHQQIDLGHTRLQGCRVWLPREKPQETEQQ